MRSRSTIAGLLLLTVCGVASPVTPTYAKGQFVLVVHPHNPASQVTGDFVSKAFLKKVQQWPNQSPIKPVDQPYDSAVRAAFSRQLLKRSTAAVRSYWQQAIFTGRNIPPPQFRSDEQVIRYVRQHVGAIGYVTSTAETTGVKVVRLVP